MGTRDADAEPRVFAVECLGGSTELEVGVSYEFTTRLGSREHYTTGEFRNLVDGRDIRLWMGDRWNGVSARDVINVRRVQV